MKEQMTFDFSGSTVLVTGSTHNLGFTIAHAFAKSHARVILHGRNPDLVAQTQAKMLALVPSATIDTVCFDLADSDAIQKGFSDLEKQGLYLNILVNNAAHLGLGTSGFLEQTPEFFRQVLEVNLFGTFLCSQLAAKQMIHRGGGNIVHISSLAGERVIHGRSAYNVSKAGIDGLNRSMAAELSRHNIRVNSIVPGYIWTPRWEALTEEVIKRRKANIPAGEPTQQEEIAQTALFLASNAAFSLTGARLVIDGGLNVQQTPRDVAV